MNRSILLALLAAAVSCRSPCHHESFDADPGWESFRSRLQPPERAIVRQRFGYSRTRNAGGEAAGEIGGPVQRDHERASYAKTIAPRTLDDRLSASGTFSVTEAGGGSGALIGWFNHEASQGWRTPQSLAFRVDGNGGKYWIFYEYGTSAWGTGGGGAFEGERYQTTPTPPYPADGTPHRWSLDYDPDGAGGRGLVTFRCDGETWELPLHEGHREQGAGFDRFGIWNQQTTGDALSIYLDDLVLDGETESFDEDPGWLAERTPSEYVRRVLRPYHDFGYSRTSHAGGDEGEVGGVMFRDEAPAYYADRAGPFTLDDELFASGTITLVSAGADSGIFLGWFDADAKRTKSTPQHEEPQTGFLGVMIEGPSRVGHYFRPAYSTSRGSFRCPTFEGNARVRPVILPDGRSHTWSLHYDPRAAGDHGRITVTWDGEPHELSLEKGDREEGARFDRFGFFNIQSGGHHVELFADELEYSKAAGEN